MEHGSKRPDVPKVAHATVRAAVGEAGRRLPGMPLIAGGKSFGGRMTSRSNRSNRCRGCAGLRSSVFHFTPPASRHGSVGLTCSMCEFPCCSCRAHGTRWQCSTTLRRSARRSARARRCGSLPTPIIHFMCRPAAVAVTRTCAPR